MTEIANPTHREKWRAQALRIAAELKQVPDWSGRKKIKVGIAFDDAIVTVTMETALIEQLDEALLADALFEGALAVQGQDAAQAPAATGTGSTPSTTPDAAADHRAAGDSAVGALYPPGMECGHAAPRAPAVTGSPAAAASTERCRRRLEPDFVEQCQENAAGGIRLILYPAATVQKRYGRRPLLDLILDLPICPACFPKMTPAQVVRDGLAAGQWGMLSKVAQQENNGWLPIQELSEIAFVPFSDPAYLALRGHLSKVGGNGHG